MVINVHSSNDNTKMPELISLLYIISIWSEYYVDSDVFLKYAILAFEGIKGTAMYVVQAQKKEKRGKTLSIITQLRAS